MFGITQHINSSKKQATRDKAKLDELQAPITQPINAIAKIFSSFLGRIAPVLLKIIQQNGTIKIAR